MPAVEKVVQPCGVIRINQGKDAQTAEEYIIYTIGPDEEHAIAVVLIGDDTSAPHRLEDLGTGVGPHRLIAPQDIIDATKKRIK